MDSSKNKITTNDEIDLMELFKKIWVERKLIYKITIVFFILGLIIAFGTPKEYKSEITLIVESNINSPVNGLLQQFGGLAGINIAGNKDASSINPNLYPNIIESTPFLLEILNQRVSYSKDNIDITVFDYLSYHINPSVISIIASNTIGLPSKLVNLFEKKKQNNELLPQNDSIIKLTKYQEAIVEGLKNRIQITTEDRSGKIILSVKMPEPLAAAQLSNILYLSLTKYLINYKIQKVKNDLDFIEKQTIDAKSRYINTEDRLAHFRDANKNITSASLKTIEEGLQNEYMLAFNLYNSLSQQLEQAKIKVQEKTPVFKVLNPAIVPLEKCKPKRTVILISMIFIGGFLGVLIIIINYIFKKYAKL